MSAENSPDTMEKAQIICVSPARTADFLAHPWPSRTPNDPELPPQVFFNIHKTATLVNLDPDPLHGNATYLVNI